MVAVLGCFQGGYARNSDERGVLLAYRTRRAPSALSAGVCAEALAMFFAHPHTRPKKIQRENFLENSSLRNWENKLPA